MKRPRTDSLFPRVLVNHRELSPCCHGDESVHTRKRLWCRDTHCRGARPMKREAANAHGEQPPKARASACDRGNFGGASRGGAGDGRPLGARGGDGPGVQRDGRRLERFTARSRRSRPASTPRPPVRQCACIPASTTQTTRRDETRTPARQDRTTSTSSSVHNATGVTIQGVDASGNAITTAPEGLPSSAAPIIQAHGLFPDFGSSNIFIQADNVTLRGFEIDGAPNDIAQVGRDRRQRRHGH